MPWNKVDIVKLRKQFIEEYLGQEFASFRDLCNSYGISRKTGYKWQDRFMNGGFDNLVDRSSAPINRPNRTPDEICLLIIATKHTHTYWGYWITSKDMNPPRYYLQIAQQV